MLPGRESSKKFYAEAGGSSSRTRGRRGKTAKDLVVCVPLGTCVYDGVWVFSLACRHPLTHTFHPGAHVPLC